MLDPESGTSRCGPVRVGVALLEECVTVGIGNDMLPLATWDSLLLAAFR